MSKIKLLSGFNFVFFIAMVTVNALANILPINGYNTGELSDLYPNLFVPAGLTFSIWAVIYLTLLVSVIFQIKESFSKNGDSKLIGNMSVFFIASSIFNIGWIFAWHYRQILLSLLMMICLFLCLLVLYSRIKIGKSIKVSSSDFWITLPFSIYTGWISIALIANVTALLVETKWDGFGIAPDVWTTVMIIIGTVLGVIYIIKNNDLYYSLVIAWALLGIYLKQMNNSTNFVSNILISSICGIIIIMIVGIYKLFKKSIYHFKMTKVKILI